MNTEPTAYTPAPAPVASSTPRSSWFLAAAAVLVSAISAVILVGTESGAPGRTVLDAAQAGNLAPVLTIALSLLAMAAVVVGMALTAVSARKDERHGHGGALGRSMLVMAGGLVVAVLVWFTIVTVWAFLQ